VLSRLRRTDLQIKDRLIIKIDSVAFGGDGVGRIDNFVAFIPFSAPGDELEIEITQVKKKFVRGKILKIIKLSPARVKPLCRYYEKCGGCCYQHLDYKHQLTIKAKQVEDSFRKIGKIDNPPILEIIASPHAYNYRGKAQYHTEALAKGWKIGFLDVSGGKLIDIEHCEIMEETINEKLSVLRESKRVRQNENDLTIWSEYLSGESNEKESVIRMVKGKSFLVPRGGFFQANLYLTNKLVDEVCRLASSKKVNTLVDAYCGSGLFSVFLAPYARNVIGIEINEKSVNYARINAENAGVKNAKFIHGDIEYIFQQQFLPSSDKADLIVLDPPRTGCEKTVLKAIVDLQPKKIIYISCNPATQARDVKYLSECGYDLLSLLPVDMFPQTEHIEVVGFLELKSKLL
jgi:tRNA/tmRNA/rRNA uracil-C5-methylase (TrmA/RlmC/RlmD family)